MFKCRCKLRVLINIFIERLSWTTNRVKGSCKARLGETQKRVHAKQNKVIRKARKDELVYGTLRSLRKLLRATKKRIHVK